MNFLIKILIVLFFTNSFLYSSWDDGLNWQRELEEAKELALYEKKPMFVFLESRTCFYCPKLKEEIFTTKEFQDKIKKYFIPVILDNSLDADSDVENTGQCPPRLTVSMTPAIYFMGPKEEKLAFRGKKHMLIYGMWDLKQMLEWLDSANKRFEKLYRKNYE